MRGGERAQNRRFENGPGVIMWGSRCRLFYTVHRVRGGIIQNAPSSRRFRNAIKGGENTFSRWDRVKRVEWGFAGGTRDKREETVSDDVGGGVRREKNKSRVRKNGHREKSGHVTAAVGRVDFGRFWKIFRFNETRFGASATRIFVAENEKNRVRCFLRQNARIALRTLSETFHLQKKKRPSDVTISYA